MLWIRVWYKILVWCRNLFDFVFVLKVLIFIKGAQSVAVVAVYNDVIYTLLR